MNNFNFTAIEGNLVRDPEVLETKAGSTFCKFTIGSNRSYKNKEGEVINDASFFDVTIWSKLAKSCGEYLKKGSRVLVSGFLQRSTWEDKEGKKNYKISITGREVNFLSSPS